MLQIKIFRKQSLRQIFVCRIGCTFGFKNCGGEDKEARLGRGRSWAVTHLKEGLMWLHGELWPVMALQSCFKLGQKVQAFKLQCHWKRVAPERTYHWVRRCDPPPRLFPKRANNSVLSFHNTSSSWENESLIPKRGLMCLPLGASTGSLSPFIELQSCCQILLSPQSVPFFHLLFSESREAPQDPNSEHQSDNFLLLLLFFNLRVFTLG